MAVKVAYPYDAFAAAFELADIRGGDEESQVTRLVSTGCQTIGHNLTYILRGLLGFHQQRTVRSRNVMMTVSSHTTRGTVDISYKASL